MSENPYQSPLSTGGDQAKKEGEPFAGCPSCSHAYATKVGFTLWGGVIGPKLLNHVKCNECGTKYNGKSGNSNFVPIVIYSIVVSLIALVVFFVVAG